MLYRGINYSIEKLISEALDDDEASNRAAKYLLRNSQLKVVEVQELIVKINKLLVDNKFNANREFDRLCDIALGLAVKNERASLRQSKYTRAENVARRRRYANQKSSMGATVS